MKAVAVPYVIALILGVAVIGLVGYWFATSGGKFGGQSSKTICDNKFLQYCITNPNKRYVDFVSAGNSECDGIGFYTQCSDVLGGTGGVARQEAQRGAVGLLGDCSGAACQADLTCCNAGSTCIIKDDRCKKSTGSCSSNNECTDNGCNAPRGGGTASCEN